VNTFVHYVTITFTDGTTWEDTETSSYLVLRNNMVRFCELEIAPENAKEEDCRIKIGDQMILINSQDDVLTTILKEISKIETTKQMFGGWEITVEKEHLFLTKAEDSTSSYVAIEHNIACAKACCTPPCAMCSSPNVCCSTKHTCLPKASCSACNVKT
jgi:TPP-dependent trihydroxycyclohexane-1,2-dione (THcHDO) dehydratase